MDLLIFIPLVLFGFIVGACVFGGLTAWVVLTLLERRRERRIEHDDK